MKIFFEKNAKLENLIPSLFIIFSFLILQLQLFAQDSNSGNNRDTIIAAAREIINKQQYCALITIDSSGLPNVRTMNPYPQEGDMIVWFATKRESRKALEIMKNPNVCVYFADHKNPTGYVAINGKAEVIDDKDLLVKKKREYWLQSVPDWKEVLVLIKIVPEKLEIVNYKYKLYGDPVTWKSPTVDFKKP
jgi:general stress protein 26